MGPYLIYEEEEQRRRQREEKEWRDGKVEACRKTSEALAEWSKRKLAKKYEGELLQVIGSVNRDHDKEDAHIKADNILCNLLKELGFEKLVELYRKVPKWYA